MILKTEQEKGGYVGRFGIPYLDDKLSCILANDLILIGARSGAGKSTLASIIAMANPKESLTLFSLENFDNDSILQEAYAIYCEMNKSRKLSLRDILSGKYNTEINWNVWEQSEEQAKKKFEHINLISRQDGYNLTNLQEDMLKAVKGGCKLIILDHIDYLDKKESSSSDVMHISEIMKTIRQMQNRYNFGIIALSHLRKPMTKEPPAVPSIDEFIGSSNKVKESTCVVMLAPDDIKNEEISKTSDNLKSTFCCIRKLRNGGFSNKTGIMYFNRDKNNYESDYKEKIVNYKGEIKDE
jgi:replicative DNA helicase